MYNTKLKLMNIENKVAIPINNNYSIFYTKIRRSGNITIDIPDFVQAIIFNVLLKNGLVSSQIELKGGKNLITTVIECDNKVKIMTSRSYFPNLKYERGEKLRDE